jgi:hypothetical protein
VHEIMALLTCIAGEGMALEEEQVPSRGLLQRAGFLQAKALRVAEHSALQPPPIRESVGHKVRALAMVGAQRAHLRSSTSE